jgi:hypothetical protein
MTKVKVLDEWINIECPQCKNSFVHRYHNRFEACPSKDYIKGRIEGLKEVKSILTLSFVKMINKLEELINKQENP